MVVVIAIALSRHTFLLPIFIGMSTMLKGMVKTLTPKFMVLLFKNSVFLKLKQILIKSSTRFFVLSHKPWRHRMRWAKASISAAILKIIRKYLDSPLWLRTLIALGLLFATASSSYLVIALLVIPQSILNWVRKKLFMTLNRSGVTHVLRTVYRFVVPADLRHQLYMHFKWTMGRQQINTARNLRKRVFSSKGQAATSLPPQAIKPDIKPDTGSNNDISQ